MVARRRMVLALLAAVALFVAACGSDSKSSSSGSSSSAGSKSTGQTKGVAQAPSLDEAKGAALAAELGPATGFLRTDVSREEDVSAMISETVDRFGRIDVLFNNAGFGGALGPIEKTTLEDWNHILDVNLTGLFLCCKYLGGAIGEGGSVINVSSIAGHGGDPGRGDTPPGRQPHCELRPLCHRLQVSPGATPARQPCRPAGPGRR